MTRWLLGLMLFGLILFGLVGCAEDPGAAVGQPGGVSGPAVAGDDAPWEALVSRAQTSYGENDHETSAELYRQAASLARAGGDERQAVALTAQRAVCLKFLGRTDEAREALIPTLASARELDDRRTEGLALGNLVRIEGLAGNDEVALGYLDELADLADRIDDPRLEVQTLEQAAMLALDLGHLQLALDRIDAALERNAPNTGEDDRRDPLIRQRAVVSARQRDDEGALLSWAAVPAVGASLANQALLFSDLGLHGKASEAAAAAMVLFAEEGELRSKERDQALYLHLAEALSAGDLDAVEPQLTAILSSTENEEATAPFRMLEGRLLLARGLPDEASIALDLARSGLGDDLGGTTAALLSAVARGLAGATSEAHEVLDTLPAGPARALVRGWLMAEVAPTDTLAMERLGGLETSGVVGQYGELQSLRLACPIALPSLSWLTLHHHLSDADRQRGADRTAEADRLVQEGVAQSLRWQLLERQALVRGRWPEPEVTASAYQRIDDWVAGRLADDEALIVVVADAQLSYLVICTAELGATSLGLAPAHDLAARGHDVAQALKSGDEMAVAQAGWRLQQSLFGRRALEDLAGHSRWALILPESLAAVPPAMLVSTEPRAGEPVDWLVLTHATRLLAHAPLSSELPGQGGGRKGWLRFGAPEGAGGDSAFTLAQLSQRYGAAALSTSRLRPGAAGEPQVSGAQATATRLRQVAGQVAALELSVPALGGGRLGGLVLSPDVSAAFGDEQAGFMPWHRLAQLSLPPLLVLDRCRFDPGDDSWGVGYAAACANAGGARWLAATRWPMPGPVREGLLGALAAAVGDGVPPDLALATLQRGFIASARASSRGDLAHPRSWAPLILVGGP